MSDLTDALEKCKNISTKETSKDLEDKEKHPFSYIYRNDHETLSAWGKVESFVENDEDRKLVIDACIELLADDKTNGYALEVIGRLSLEYAEKLEENNTQPDFDYISRLADLIVHIDNHSDVEDSDMKYKMYEAEFEFNQFTGKNPEITHKLCEKYIADNSAAKTRLFEYLLWNVADTEKDVDFLKEVKQKVTSKEFSVLEPEETNKMIIRINFSLLDKEANDKDLCRETWARIQTHEDAKDWLDSIINHSAKDGELMQSIAGYITEHNLQKDKVYKTLIDSALRYPEENQQLIHAFVAETSSSNIAKYALQHKGDHKFYKLCINEIMQRADSEFEDFKISRDVIKLPEVSQHILAKMSDNASELSDKKVATDVINLCNIFIEEHPNNKEIEELVKSVADKIPLKNVRITQKVLSLYNKIALFSPESIDKDKKNSIQQSLNNSIKDLLKDGNIKEAIEVLIIKEKNKKSVDVQKGLTSDATAYNHKLSMDIIHDILRHKTIDMNNGCVAVGFLCEDRSWKNFGKYTNGGGTAWQWYATGVIIDTEQAEIVKSCQTDTIQVRHPFDANQDIYNNINMEDFMSVNGDKVDVYVGEYVSASMEYKKNTKEDELTQKISNKLQELKEKAHTDNIEDIPHAKTQVLRELAKDNLGKPKRSNADKQIIKSALDKVTKNTRN